MGKNAAVLCLHPYHIPNQNRRRREKAPPVTRQQGRNRTGMRFSGLGDIFDTEKAGPSFRSPKNRRAGKQRIAEHGKHGQRKHKERGFFQ